MDKENGSSLESDALSSVPWDVSFWPATSLQFDLRDETPAAFWIFTGAGAIESIVIVPEPSTGLLCGLGLAALAATRRLRA